MASHHTVSTDDLHDLAQRRLRRVGQRYTEQRRDLLTVLAALAKPVTIPQLLVVRTDWAQSSLYRNLAVLEQARLVGRVVAGDGHAHFELTEELTAHHHHLICEECASVTDIELPGSVEAAMTAAFDAAADEVGYEVRHHRLDLVGTCAACRSTAF